MPAIAVTQIIKLNFIILKLIEKLDNKNIFLGEIKNIIKIFSVEILRLKKFDLKLGLDTLLFKKLIK